MRFVNLVAPIGKGTRGLIVSLAKVGKTVLLEKMTKYLNQSRLILLRQDRIRPTVIVNFLEQEKKGYFPLTL